MTSPIVGGDDLVRELETRLRENIPTVMDYLVTVGALEESLGDVRTWQVVPTADAIAAAALPAIAIVSPTMRGTPTRSALTYSGTWELSVGIFARGRDHEDTQTRIQAWAKVIRAAALLTPFKNPRTALVWVGEEYDLIPTREDARTIAGAEVMFDAPIDTALDLGAIRSPGVPNYVDPTSSITLK